MPEMDADTVRHFLEYRTRTAKLATVRSDGRPHVMPVWFVLDGDELVFTTGRETIKGRNLRRTGEASLCVDDENPPFAYVHISGTASVIEGAEDLLAWTTRIARRYVGSGQAEAYGRRNAVEGELLVRVSPGRVIAESDVAAW